MKRAKKIGILTCLLSILLLVNTAIAVEKEISDKKDAEYHIKLAKEYVEKNQFNKAVEEWTKAISLRPKDFTLYRLRADLYEKLKQHDKAIRDYTKVIELKPDDASNYLSRGSVYVSMGQYREAEADFRKACDLEKDFCTLLTELTEIKRELAEIEKWQPYEKSEKESFFYDKTSIRKQSNGHIRVWIKIKGDDVSAYIERRKKKYQKTEGYENYSHSLYLWEFDCNSANAGLISAVDYDDKGKVLDLFNIDKKSLEMTSVIPDSIGYLLYKIVCKEER